MNVECSTPCLDEFAIDRLCGQDAVAADEASSHLKFLNALLVWFEVEGVEKTISVLNEKGHHFFPVSDAAEGWRIFREPGAGGERDFQISFEMASGDVMLSTPASDAAWEKMIEKRKQNLTSEALEIEALREQFYVRGGLLFSERYDEVDALDDKDFVLMALYVLDIEVNNGGFSQYFANTGGRDSERAEVCLGKIGAVAAQSLLRQAIDLIGKPFNNELTNQQYDALNTHESALGRLDDLYYDLNEDISLMAVQWTDRS